MSVISDWYNKNKPKVTVQMDPRETQVCADIDRQISEAERLRQPFVRQALVGEAMYNPKTQWFEFNTREGRMREAPRLWDSQPRVTIPLIPGVVDTIAAALTNTQPGWEVTPATSEDVDVESAKASDKLLEHIYREEAMSSKSVEWVKWAALSGIGWLYAGWDPTLGEEVPPEMEPVEGPWADGGMAHEGAEGEARKPGWELEEGDGNEGPPPLAAIRRTGAPTVKVIPSTSLYWDPGATDKDLRDMRWIAHVAYLHIDEVYERWPDRAIYVTPDTSFSEDSYSQTVLGQEQNVDRCKVITYYERASVRHPRGYWAVKCGKILLDETGGLPGGKLPFACIRYNAVAGRFWGDGLVSRIEDCQRRLNHEMTKLMEVVNLWANPKWIVAEGSVKRTQFTNEPAEVIEYNPHKAAPYASSPPAISPEHRQIAQEAERYMMTIAGVGPITAGEVPPGVSGRAAALMQEIDAAKRQPVVREMAEALERIGGILLALCRDNMAPESIIRVVGSNNRLEAMAFQSGSIRSTDVRINMSSMAARHPTIQREQTLQAFERGALGDPASPDVIAETRRALALPGLDSAGNGGDPEENYALETAFELLDGRSPPVYPWENHAVHIRALRRLLQTGDVRQSPPEIIQNITTALATREAYVAAAAGGGTPWWMQSADPKALALLNPPAPAAPKAAPPAAPASPVGPPPFDAFGAPPEAFIPPPAGVPLEMQNAPPVPLGKTPMGLPLRGEGVRQMDTGDGM